MSSKVTEGLFMLRHTDSPSDPGLMEDLRYMFADMRLQADILRRFPVTASDEAALVFLPRRSD